MAKRSTGVQLIDQPRTPEERWLKETVAVIWQKAWYRHAGSRHFSRAAIKCLCHGLNRNDALVAVSAGLMQRFDREEIRCCAGP